ncbi:uncharacterized protein CDAR_259711 [Caerostris darwini]|uniref:Uncharacterized protein n=1 Tax=Caerostris darwini TaxID=1538125 RepID=A0AAV4VMT2_9ARAC|nr:uncharacterized protein CDAR_259711 [Caerostris darwini]
MTSRSETEINLKTLQRTDSHIIEIIDNASQVAIYKYDEKSRKWESTGIGGALFLYRRSVQPYHGLIIMNRNSTTDYFELITHDMELKLQEPYFLYRNNMGKIFGSWFYDEKDFKRITKKIQTIILKQTVTPRLRSASDSDTKNGTACEGFLALLSQATDEYYTKNEANNQTKNKDVDNNLNSHSEKKPHQKFAKSFTKSPKNFITRSISHDNSTSPRKRFMSTGSFNADSASHSKSFGQFQNTVSNGNEKIAVKDFKASHLSRENKVAPPSLSPLFSHDEISTPIFENKSTCNISNLQHSNISDNSRNISTSNQSFDTQDWKTHLSSDCDAHFTSMKQVLKSHIEDNPNMMLKIHEAYVSSLRSLFIKN